MESTLTKVVRVLAGLLLVVSGLNKFLHFFAPGHSDVGGAFLGNLAGAPWMFPTIGVVEVLAGAGFVTGNFVALGALAMAPITYNIVLFHLAIDMPADPVNGLSNAGAGFFVGLANAYLLFANMPKYQDLLRAK